MSELENKVMDFLKEFSKTFLPLTHPLIKSEIEHSKEWSWFFQKSERNSFSYLSEPQTQRTVRIIGAMIHKDPVKDSLFTFYLILTIENDQGENIRKDIIVGEVSSNENEIVTGSFWKAWPAYCYFLSGTLTVLKNWMEKWL